MTKSFKSEIQIHFRQADPAGILFFGQVFSLAHDCFEGFIADTGIGWKAWFHNKEHIVPIRHTECNYLKPFFAGEKYMITATVAKFGESSFQMQYVFSKDNAVHAEVKMVHAYIDAKTKQKVLLPLNIKEKLTPYLVIP